MNALRDLEVKTHLRTLDLRMELLSTKHENLLMSMDNLATDMMKYKQQEGHTKSVRGKKRLIRTKLEVLHKLDPQ